jgi:hypothetical protein
VHILCRQLQQVLGHQFGKSSPSVYDRLFYLLLLLLWA